MKSKYFILFLLVNSICGFSQNKISGNWYTFSSDMLKIIESKYDSTYIKNRNLDWNLLKIEDRNNLKILKTISKNDKIYYLLNDESKNNNKIVLSIIDNISTDISFRQPILDEEKTTFTNISSAEKFINNDTISRHGLIFYSEKEMNRIKSLVNIQTITKNDYLSYLKTLLKAKNEYKKNKNPDMNLMFLFLYLPNKAREILIYLKYNAIISDRELNEINSKFNSDIEVQKIQAELNQF